jgi:hypothetical protein
MSRNGDQPPPLSLATLLVALEELDAPAEVREVLVRIRKVIQSPTPRTTLNRSFCRLRERRPGIFGRVAEWLATSEDVRVKMAQCGAHAVWRRAIKAFQEIDGGVTPHAAWGMNRPGRPRRSGLSKNEVAGARAELARRTAGLRKGRACVQAIDAIDPEHLEESNVARARKRFEHEQNRETLKGCAVVK